MSRSFYLSLLFCLCLPAFSSAAHRPASPDHASAPPTNVYPPPPYPNINFCPGATLATISAPVGYVSYQWFAPGPVAVPPLNGGNTPTLTILNPVPGTAYTLQVVAVGGATYTTVDTLQYTAVSIYATGTTTTCLGGASGSASIIAAGSLSGYNYAWYGPSGPGVISTNTTISNLTPGVYSVGINAAGAASCGSAVATVTIDAGPSTYTVVKTFCGNTAYLSTPPLASNIQWYNNLTPIPSNMGGAAPGYTAVLVSNGSVFRVRYLTPQGCQDSVTLLLALAPNGSIHVAPSSACAGNNNGTAVFTVTPSGGGAMPSFLSVYTMPVGASFSPAVTSPNAPTFSVNNLPAGSYSVSAFDGNCQYYNLFSVASYTYNFNIGATPAICPGNSGMASISFTTPISPSQYTFSWSPVTNIAGSNTSISILLTPPTPALNSSVTTVYTVMVTPTLVSCPISKTVAVTAINFPTPTLSAIPVFCQNDPTYIITALPAGGTFFSSDPNQPVTPQGVIVPSLAATGVNTFSYSFFPGSCADLGGSFTINSIPSLTVSGNTVFCQGQSTTLTVSGAGNYSWSTGSAGNQVTLAPAFSGTCSVSGSLGNGCQATEIVSLTVNNNPALSVTGNTILCEGGASVLNVSGADIYSWPNGFTTNQVTVTPTASGNYTVTGTYTASGCSTVKMVSLTVNPNPALAVTGSTAICSGQTATLNASGASTYSWSNGPAVSQITLTPAGTGNYLVTGTTAATGCTSSLSVIITVHPNPTLSVSGKTLICQGEATTLNASGPVLYYYWNNSSTPSNSFYSASPLTSTTYSVLGADANGCQAIKTIFITVAPCTGIESAALNSSNVKLYPNPNKGLLHVELSEVAGVFVYDELGRLVLETRLEAAASTLDISRLPNGIYLVKTIGASEQHLLKLIKQDN